MTSTARRIAIQHCRQRDALCGCRTRDSGLFVQQQQLLHADVLFVPISLPLDEVVPSIT